MHRRFFILRRIFCAGFFLLCCSEAEASVQVKTTNIAHGIRAWYAADSTVPVVDLQLSFEGAGSISDPTAKGGRAAFAAAMLTEGAGSLDAAAFQKALDDHAITLSAEANDDRMIIHLHCLREDAPRAAELLAQALSQPQLAEPDAQRVKAQLTMLLAQLEESPVYVAQRLLAQRAFAGHPYGNAPYGNAASIATLNGQDVRDYLKTYVTRGNLLIAAAGDVDAGLLDDMLTPVIDALPENDTGPVSVVPATVQGAGEMLRQTMDVPQSAIAFLGPYVPRSDPHFYAAYLLNHILGGNALVSRLSQDVRQTRGLVYSAETSLSVKRGGSFIDGALATRNGNADEAIAATKSVLATLHDRGVTTEECADAKRYVEDSFPLQLDSTGAVAQMLLVMQAQHLGEDYLGERNALFEKVSCADMNALAAEWLQPERFLFAVVGGTTAMTALPSVMPAAAPTDVR